MSASENVATSLEQAIIMIAAGNFSVIEQIIKDKVKK